ncbi:MAG: type VII secretion protein EccB [Kineosporiaceae bacterium]
MAPPNRRDRLQAYQFLLQRMVSAFVTRDTDPIRSPFRRGGITMFVGVMIMIVVMAGAGVYGLLRPGGSTSWRQDGALIVDRGTGAVFVYRDATLHPMANFASARLLASTGSPVRTVAAASLTGTPRGRTLGIPGAPDTLPASRDMLRGPWTLCSEPTTEGDTVSGARTVLMVGTGPGTGTDPAERGLLTTGAETGAMSLVWQGRRHALGPGVLEALALTQRPRHVVDEAWLEALPRGEDIVTPAVDDLGDPSEAVPGTAVGQVLRVRSEASTEEFYLVLGDRLRPVTPLLAAVLVGSPSTREAYPDGRPDYVDVGPGEVADVPRETVDERPDDLAAPVRLPALVEADEAAASCAVFAGPGDPPALLTGVAEVPTGRPVEATGDDTARLVDEVVVPPGQAVLVEAPTAPGVDAGALSLVTDSGLRYGIPGVEAVQLLGYGQGELVTMPSALVDRIPAGPSLDPERAAEPARF